MLLAWRANSSSSRLLPIPGSPLIEEEAAVPGDCLLESRTQRVELTLATEERPVRGAALVAHG